MSNRVVTAAFGLGGIRIVKRTAHQWEFDRANERLQLDRTHHALGPQEMDWIERASLHTAGLTMTCAPLLIESCEVCPKCGVLTVVFDVGFHLGACVVYTFDPEDDSRLARAAAYLAYTKDGRRYTYMTPLTTGGYSENDIDLIHPMHTHDMPPDSLADLEDGAVRLEHPKISWKGNLHTALEWVDRMARATGASRQAVQRILSACDFDLDEARPRLLHLRNATARMAKAAPPSNVVYLHGGASFDRDQFALYLHRRYGVSQEAANRLLQSGATLRAVEEWAGAREVRAVARG